MPCCGGDENDNNRVAADSEEYYGEYKLKTLYSFITFDCVNKCIRRFECCLHFVIFK